MASAGSSKARICVHSNQLRLLSKLNDERHTVDSLSVDNMESQVITVEHNRNDMNNCSQETSFLLLNYQFF
jgi:hypothetical protein